VAVVFAALALTSCAGRGGEPPPDPAELYARHNPPVIARLAQLGPEDVGRALEGVTVGEETRHLEGYVYRGRVPGLGPGRHVQLFDRPAEEGTELVAAVWVEAGAEPLPLPECDPGRPGFRAQRLWGAIYTWKAARPGDGVLLSQCPRREWVAALEDGSAGAGQGGATP